MFIVIIFCSIIIYCCAFSGNIYLCACFIIYSDIAKVPYIDKLQMKLKLLTHSFTNSSGRKMLLYFIWSLSRVPGWVCVALYVVDVCVALFAVGVCVALFVVDVCMALFAIVILHLHCFSIQMVADSTALMVLFSRRFTMSGLDLGKYSYENLIIIKCYFLTIIFVEIFEKLIPKYEEI